MKTNSIKKAASEDRWINSVGDRYFAETYNILDRCGNTI